MRGSLRRFCLIATALLPLSAWAGTAVPFTINLSKPVNVVTSGGTPRIAVDVAGTTRYANYTSGSGTSALVFTYNMQAGDVDLDGVAVSSPVQLNGGTIKDLSGNPLTNLTFTPPNTAGIKVNYPSLGMDFTNGAGGRYTLNGTPYTTLASFLTAAGGSFTRASVGTYFDSAGVLQTASANTPRLDYDPVTHAAKGILIEEARTNLLTRSSEFENAAAWGNVAIVTVTPNTSETTAPDGSNNAEKIGMNSTGNATKAQNAVVSGTSVVFTVYVKQGSGATDLNGFGIRNSTTGSNLLMVNLNYSTGAVSYSLGSSGASATPVGNGWWRVSLALTSGITAGNTVKVYNGQSGGSYTAGQYFYTWGAQLEQGAFPTSYIPTTTAAVTRQADVLTVPTGGWFNLPASTLMLAGDIAGTTGGGFQIGFGTNSTNYLGFPYVVPAGLNGAAFYRASGAGPTLNGSPSLAFNTNYKAGYAYSVAAGSASYSKNGVLSDTGTGVAAMGSATTFMLGAAPFNSNSISGHIQKAKYYPARVPNAQLQLMTQ